MKSSRAAAQPDRSRTHDGRGSQDTGAIPELSRQIEALAKQVKSLSREVTQLKKAKTAR